MASRIDQLEEDQKESIHSFFSQAISENKVGIVLMIDYNSIECGGVFGMFFRDST